MPEIDDSVLTMIRDQDWPKVQKAYELVMNECMGGIEGHMCWPVDWFPEHLNVESAPGNSIYFQLDAMANPHNIISQWPPVDRSGPLREDVLVFADSYGFCTEIMEQAPPGRVGIANIQSKRADKYTEKEVQAVVGMHPWDLIIFAAGIDPPESNTVDAVHEQQNAVLRLYFWILQKIGDDARCCKRLCVLTADVFAEEREVHEENGLGLVANSTLFGMTNTARLELQCVVHFIDTEWALESENTKSLVSEIFRNQSFGHNTVRVLNRGRYVMRQVPSKPYEAGPDFRVPDSGTIAITGGNGGIALVFGVWILHKAAQQGGKCFSSIKFLSRSAKVSDRNMSYWTEIKRAAAEIGVEVEQIKCDMSKRAEIEAFVQQVSPDVTGFIHAAGILQDSMMANQTWEKFETVLAAKSRAALFFHDALERMGNHRLELFWLFSAGAVYGNMGQLNYSAANSFLDGLARHRRALGKPAVAPQWGAWGEVGMAAEMDEASRKRMANSPMPFFTNAEGLRGFECLLRSGLAYGWVLKFNPQFLFFTVQGDESTMQCYGRNFTSFFAPPPPSDPHRNPYTTIAYTLRKACHRLPEALVFNHFWPDLAASLKHEEESGT